MCDSMVVSVITVCYNEAKTIRKVMDSVLSQTFDSFEYIVKDGGSTDGTNEIIDSYRGRFEEKGISFYHLSGKDGGLYDAMNIGVKNSHGVWVNFMNADDCFYDEHVLTRIFEGKTYEDSALLYGDALEEEFGEYYYYKKCPELIESRMPFNHQTVFAKKEIMEKYPFDLTYRIGADYNFLLTVYKAGLKMTDTGVLTSVIAKDGVSTVRLRDTYIESIAIRRSHGIPQMSDEELKKALRFVGLKQFGMDYFPKWLKYLIRKVQRVRRGQNQTVQRGNADAAKKTE